MMHVLSKCRNSARAAFSSPCITYCTYVVLYKLEHIASLRGSDAAWQDSLASNIYGTVKLLNTNLRGRHREVLIFFFFFFSGWGKKKVKR